MTTTPDVEQRSQYLVRWASWCMYNGESMECLARFKTQIMSLAIWIRLYLAVVEKFTNSHEGTFCDLPGFEQCGSCSRRSIGDNKLYRRGRLSSEYTAND